MNIRAYIDNSDFFGNASEKNRELLASICIPKNLTKKETLFYEGDKGYAFFLLGSGAISLYKRNDEGKTVVVKTVDIGEFFGEVILFEKDTYPVTATAIKPSLVFIIPKLQFLCLMKDENFRDDFIRILISKQRYLIERIKYLTLYDVEERIILFLKEHADNSNRVKLTMAKKDIASAIGTTPETYSRIITKLIKERKINMEGRTIKLFFGK
ncbi:MAG: Crp/Fnr family transcriptional regulator [Chitinispirillaceae bacterium]|nr:Crp/Fnr family transcriptional regulator [Chitinispirillaceae bacterium]